MKAFLLLNRPKYRVAIEQRVYQTTDEDSLLVGIPDVAVQRSQTTTNSETQNIAVAAPPVQAVTVTIYRNNKKNLLLQDLEQ